MGPFPVLTIHTNGFGNHAYRFGYILGWLSNRVLVDAIDPGNADPPK